MTHSPQKPPDPRLRMTAGLGVLFILFACSALTTVALASYVFLLEPQLGDLQVAGLLDRPTATPTRPPTPVPPCAETLVQIGELQVRVQFLPREPDGTFHLPQGQAGTAYWLEGSTPHYAFALSPARENRVLADSVQPGQPAVIRWGDCSLEEYVVRSVEQGQPDESAIFSRPSSGFSLYLQEGASGFTVVAGHPEVAPADTPEPVEGEILANYIFLGDEISADGTAFILHLEIENAGFGTITLTSDDIGLTPEGGQELPPSSVDPALPVEIPPGESRAFTITFPHPRTSTAVVRVLDISFDFYY